MAPPEFQPQQPCGPDSQHPAPQAEISAMQNRARQEHLAVPAICAPNFCEPPEAEPPNEPMLFVLTPVYAEKKGRYVQYIQSPSEVRAVDVRIGETGDFMNFSVFNFFSLFCCLPKGIHPAVLMQCAFPGGIEESKQIKTKTFYFPSLWFPQVLAKCSAAMDDVFGAASRIYGRVRICRHEKRTLVHSSHIARVEGERGWKCHAST